MADGILDLKAPEGTREVRERTLRPGGRWLLIAGLVGLPLCLLPGALTNLPHLPLILLPLMMATLCAYWLRHRLEQDASPSLESR